MGKVIKCNYCNYYASRLDFFRPQKIKTTVDSVKQLTDKVVLVRFGLDHEAEFIPGQFANIVVSEGIQRSYSISSLPGEKYIETYVDISPGGPGSKFFKGLNEKDQIDMIFPLGRFTYKESDQILYFIATGTGITPFISMIRYALEKLNNKRQIKLLFGVRYQKDIFLHQEFNELSKKYSNFAYQYYISQPDEGSRIPAKRVTDCLTEINISSDSEVYICGGQEMIRDVEKIMVKNGVMKRSIYYEQYY